MNLYEAISLSVTVVSVIGFFGWIIYLQHKENLDQQRLDHEYRMKALNDFNDTDDEKDWDE